jgi:hypothetical protein
MLELGNSFRFVVSFSALHSIDRRSQRVNAFLVLLCVRRDDVGSCFFWWNLHNLAVGVICNIAATLMIVAALLRLASASGDSVEDLQAPTVSIDLIAARKSACVAVNMQMAAESIP